MTEKCTKCEVKVGVIGNKTSFCKKCGTLLTESLFTNKDEIDKIAMEQIDANYKKMSIDIGIETDDQNKIIAIHYPNLNFVLGKILK